MGSAEKDVTSILVLFIVAAIIADLITHGSATAMVLRPILQFLNSGLSIASGGAAKTVA
jgi:hypothetical protein